MVLRAATSPRQRFYAITVGFDPFSLVSNADPAHGEISGASAERATEHRHAPDLDTTVFQQRLAALPLATYQDGETILTAGSKTGQLLILKEGAVAILKDGVEIAKVAEPGAVFGELGAAGSAAHGRRTCARDLAVSHRRRGRPTCTRPDCALYVAAILARRLDGANRALIELKHQIEAGQPLSDRQDGREDGGAAGRWRCQSRLCRLSI